MKVTALTRSVPRRWSLCLLTAILVFPAIANAGTRGREPLILPQVGDTFGAPYDVVWDATLKNLGVLKILVADKAAGRIETESFPFAFTVRRRPSGASDLLVPASLDPGASPLLAQDGNDGRATQVLWISMQINVVRASEANKTHVLVQPRVHDQLLMLFTPGPTNSPWGDLFAKIHSFLGGR